MMLISDHARQRASTVMALAVMLLVASCAGDKERADTPTPSGVNLVRNGSFEEVGEDGLPVGWTLKNFRGLPTEETVQWEVDNATAVEGVNAFLFRSDPTTRRFLVLVQELEVRDAKRIQLKGWMQLQDVDRGPDQFSQCNFLLTFYDENHSRFQDMRFADKRTRIKQGTIPWFQEDSTFRLPEGTRYVEVACILGMSGRAWFDKIELSIPQEFAWETAESENYRFHWYPGHELPDSARTKQQAFFNQCEERLQIESDVVISYYYYPDSLSIRTALSLKGVQYVSWNDVEIHTIRQNDFHESLHFITDYYGRPTRAIVEGTLHWLRNEWGGQPIPKVAAHLLSLNRLPPMELLTSYGSFVDIPVTVSMPAAAGFITYLVDNWGAQKLMELYEAIDGANNYPAFASGFQRVYGVSVADVEKQWRLWLQTIDTSDLQQ